jgi:RecA-family ATPase
LQGGLPISLEYLSMQNGHRCDESAPQYSMGWWSGRNIPEPDWLMGSCLSTTNRWLIVAPTGLGKTNFVLALGMRIANGEDFLHWKGSRKARVVYIDGEMSIRLLKQRLDSEVRRIG